MAQANSKPSRSQNRVVVDVNTTKENQVAEEVSQQETETVVQETAPVAEVSEVKVTQAAPVGTYASYSAEFLTTGNTYQRDTVNGINTYLAAMSSKRPSTEAQLAAAQKSFLSVLRNILQVVPTSEFRTLWSLVLLAAKENAEDVFNEFYLFRGALHWSGTDTDIKQLFALLNLIMKTRDPENRAEGLAEIRIKTVHDMLNPTAVERLTAFYA